MLLAVAAEMGLDESDVSQSKIIRQGLENMKVVDDRLQHHSNRPPQQPPQSNNGTSLESLGFSSADLQKILSSVSTIQKSNEDVSMVYPEVAGDPEIIGRIKAAIRDTQQKINDPGYAHMIPELKRRLDSFESKLRQEIGRELPPPKRPPSNPSANRPRHPPPGVATGSNAQALPGAWGFRSGANRDVASARPAAAAPPPPAPRRGLLIENSRVDWHFTNSLAV